VKNNLHVFLGATVADAAARPLHWVYNQKKLNSYIRGKKDFTFLKKNKSPFYNIKTGKVSGYNEIGQVMFQTLLENYENIEKEFKKNILKNFGPGSKYWKNLNLRSKYKKVKDWLATQDLGRGVSVGDNLEYTDEITLGRSIVKRIPFDQN